MTKIDVSSDSFRPYQVRVDKDLLSQLPKLITPFLKARRVFLITDAHIAALHLSRVMDGLQAADIKAEALILEAGEHTKSWEGLKQLTDALVGWGLDRKDIVIALGGGVIGDLTGFAASIYMRGIDFIQIPTTLLAQVDSSVGGKTAIDHPLGKNLLGAFHQPRLVLCDLNILSTLPKREILCGYAEVIKYGLLGDLAFFEWLEANVLSVLSLEAKAIQYAVATSVAMKAEIVAADEREGGKRALLNLGHTFGHALEAELGFGDRLLHGEAVAIGMAMAFRYSSQLGLCPQDHTDRAVAAISKSGLPTHISHIPSAEFEADKLITHMGHDKKAEGGRLVFILLKGIGEAFIEREVNPASLRAFLLTEGAK
jgi:3-dehydroquinate synthase